MKNSGQNTKSGSHRTPIICILGCLKLSHISLALRSFFISYFLPCGFHFGLFLFLCLQVNELCYSVVANLLLISSNVISTSDIVLLSFYKFDFSLFMSFMFLFDVFKISVTSINVKNTVIIIMSLFANSLSFLNLLF